MHGYLSNHTDYRAVVNFQDIIVNNGQFTSSQANLIIKILTKYQSLAKKYNLDYEDNLANPVWRTTFRVLDLTKKIFLKIDENNKTFIHLKFPYQLKEDFDITFPPDNGHSYTRSWIPEEKIRKIPVNSINIIHLHEWAKKHDFEFDQDFLDLVFFTENLWSQEEKFTPHSVIFENSVILINSTEDADNYFEKFSTTNLDNNLLLAKSMNFPLRTLKKPLNLVEKICSTKENIFWLKEIEKFFELAEKISGKIVVLIDRASDRDIWLKNFVKISEKFPQEREKIKVCFRDDKHDKGNFNQWIRDEGLGGSVDQGKYLIFENKPAKWLFKEDVDVKIIVTNNLYMNSNAWVNDWMEGHPCVIYLSDVKPTLKRMKNIATL
jgi:hypothetical protein